jgi:hypothetical protein
LVLKDVRINGILDNGQLTFASGSPAESPALTGDEVRLSQLLQYYVWQGAAVEYKVYYFAGTTDDPTTYKTQTIFKGIVQSVDLPQGQIVFNLTQPTKAEDTLIPRRKVTDPPDPNAKGQFIPLVYGQFKPAAAPAGLSWSDAAVAGFHPALAPVISQARLTSYLYLATNDCYGVNTGWLGQDPFASNLASDAADGLVMYYPEADAWGIIEEGSGDGDSAIYSDEVALGDSFGITVKVNQYQTALVYVPCNGIFTDADSIVDNPAALLARDPFQYANVTCDDGALNKVVQFTISPISIMGEIPLETDCIGAYLVIGARAAFVGTPGVRFGIYSIPSADWVGYYDGAVYGVMSATDLRTANLYTQKSKNSVAVPTTAYVQASGAQQPIMRMDWRYVKNASGGPEGECVVRVLISAAGGSGDTFKLIACGAVCKVKLKTGGAVITKTSPVVDITGRIVRR